MSVQFHGYDFGGTGGTCVLIFCFYALFSKKLLVSDFGDFETYMLEESP